MKEFSRTNDAFAYCGGPEDEHKLKSAPLHEAKASEFLLKLQHSDDKLWKRTRKRKMKRIRRMRKRMMKRMAKNMRTTKTMRKKMRGHMCQRTKKKKALVSK